MSSSASSSSAAILGRRRSSWPTASPSRWRACSPSAAVKIDRMIAPSSVVLILRAWPQAIAQEVHRAALPRRAEDLRQRGLQARVGVGDGELHADQAARDQTAQELAPERLGLGGADVQADDLAPAGLVDGVRDHDALARTRPPSRTFSTFASTNRYG